MPYCQASPTRVSGHDGGQLHPPAAGMSSSGLDGGRGGADDRAPYPEARPYAAIGHGRTVRQDSRRPGPVATALGRPMEGGAGGRRPALLPTPGTSPSAAPAAFDLGGPTSASSHPSATMDSPRQEPSSPGVSPRGESSPAVSFRQEPSSPEVTFPDLYDLLRGDESDLE